ncbi:MAG: hypothetical protein HUJ61_08655, partial [Bacilli bacterium]|nr:hypothetical protein [Bacilli bacterium]
MEVDRDQIFNLWDTNGRRKDVLNALSLYLGIIKEMVDDGTFDEWASFPNSITQFIFYSKAIEQSPEVFKRHPKYDDFINELGVESYLSVNKKFFSETISNEEQLLETLDKDIEQRARHYTSNLVRFGFASNERKITQSGYSYLSSNIEKDSMEKMLSLNETNIILLRQLMKLRIFSKNCGGKRTYYSPFYVGLYLLLNNDTLGKDDFISIVQGINPYLDFEIIKEKLKYNNVQDLIQYIVDNSVEIGSVPIVFMLPGKITKKNFDEYIENRKTTSTVDCYYEFYESLLEFVENRSVENYERLKLSYISNKDKIKKAFCLGKTIFDFGTNGIFSLDEFNLHNENNVFLNSEHLNETFYKMYKKSKYIDQVAEYSDTTIRVLGATGLFKFKTMPELSNKTLMSILFN